MDLWMVSEVSVVSHTYVQLTVVVLPEIHKRPVKPELEALLNVLIVLALDGGGGVLALGVERVWLDGAEARVLAQTGHARHKLVGTNARVQDGVQCRACNLSRLAVELVADTEEERAQALHKWVNTGGLGDRADELWGEVSG